MTYASLWYDLRDRRGAISHESIKLKTTTKDFRPESKSCSLWTLPNDFLRLNQTATELKKKSAGGEYMVEYSPKILVHKEKATHHTPWTELTSLLV